VTVTVPATVSTVPPPVVDATAEICLAFASIDCACWTSPVIASAFRRR